MTSRAASSRRAVRNPAPRSRTAWLIMVITFSLGVVATVAWVMTAPSVEDIATSFSRFTIGILCSLAVTAVVGAALAVVYSRRATAERAWYESVFGGDPSRVLATLDSQYIAELLGLPGPKGSVSEAAFAVLVYRYPYLPPKAAVGVLALAQADLRSGNAANEVPNPATASPLAEMDAWSRAAERYPLVGSWLTISSVVLLVGGILTWVILAPLSESMWLWLVALALLGLAAFTFLAGYSFRHTHIPRAEYRAMFGSSAVAVVAHGGAEFVAQVTKAADGPSLIPAIQIVHDRYPMVRGLDAVDVVRAAQRA